jgi:hypothetical protein
VRRLVIDDLTIDTSRPRKQTVSIAIARQFHETFRGASATLAS